MTISNLLNSLRSLFFFNEDTTDSAVQQINPDLQSVQQLATTDYGILDTDIYPKQYGFVRYEASRWRAQNHTNFLIKRGTLVKILGRIGLTLIVEPLEM